jgi:hypothetical protein
MKLDKLELPESLKQRLATFEHRLYVAETVVTICGALCGLVVSWLLLFISDRIWDTPGVLRLGLMVVGVVAFGLCFRFWLRHWVLNRRDVFNISRLIQRRFPWLGDRLLGIVELSDVARRTSDISPELCKAAIRQVAGETEKTDFEKAIDRRRPRRLLAALGVAAVVVIGIVALDYRAAWNSLRRWVTPLSPIERYTLVELTKLPGRMHVPHGEPFRVAFGILEESRWHPDSASYVCGDQPRKTVPVVSNRVDMDVAGQTRKVDMDIRVGDATHTIKIVPAYRSSLDKIWAEIKLPDYLGYPVQEEAIGGGRLTLVRGSRFALAGRTTRELNEAFLDVGEKLPLEVEGVAFKSPQFGGEEFRKCAIEWRDVLGLWPKQPPTLAIEVREDDAPRVDCPEMASAVAILQNETLKIAAVSRDDFGVKGLWMETEITKAPNSAYEGRKGEQKVKDGAQTARELRGEMVFSPEVMDIPPESVVMLCASSLDYFPGRKRSESPKYLVYVLSWAQHAELIRQKFEMLQTQLGELIDREQELKLANEEMSKLPDQELEKAEAGQKLEDQEKAEKANRADLERLAKEGTELLKEALRNKEMDPKALADMAEYMETMGQVAQGEMKDAQSALQQAQQQQQGQQRREDVEEAVKKQEEALKKLREAQEKMGKTLDEMMAHNFVNRLRTQARKETGISGVLKEVAPKTAGVPFEKLAGALKKQLTGASEAQDNVRRSIRGIKDDLDGFFVRSRIEKYKTVLDEMEEVHVLLALEGLTTEIAHNRVFQSVAQTKKWADQFNKWADLLEEKPDEREGEGEGEGQEMPPEMIELLIEMLQIVQGEADLREKTRALEDRRHREPKYAEKSTRLGDEQDELHTRLAELEKKVPIPQLVMLMMQARGAMKDAEALLRKPDTGRDTVAAETEVIELLSGVMSQMAQQAGGGGGGAGMMAMLMQMMGLGAGQTPGGSMAGGTTGRLNIPGGGPSKGEKGEERGGPKDAGRVLEQVPPEFRDAVEAYFRKVDTLR